MFGDKVKNAIYPVLILIVFSSIVSTHAVQSMPVVFTHGVASGDVTPVSVVLWTRVNQEARLTVEVSKDPAFGVPTIRRSVLAPAQDDFTAKAFVAPLQPGQTYYYRWRQGVTTSEVGSFRTPRLPFLPSSLRFAYTGDSDGTKVFGSPFFNNFEVLDAVRGENPDFFVYLGDTIYSDSVIRPAPAVTLSEYRDAYKVNREYANLRNLLKATSTYAIWDDHEVRNDFDSQTVDQAVYANGREAFLEYMPVQDVFRLQDPACAGDPLFRAFRWGSDIDIIILDERSCRSAEAVDACSFAPGVLDLVPTLPSFIRVQLGLPASPPPGCLDAISDPSRTILGSVQKNAFLTVLQASTAKYKFVINEVAIQQFYALPYDRWEGYAAERVEVLSFIRTNQIENVIFLTTDNHAVVMNEVFIDRFTDPQQIAYEAVVGPVATFTFQQEALAFGGQSALNGLNFLLTLVGVDCRNLNVFSYGLVDVNTNTGIVIITAKDGTGAIIHDQQNASTACTKTL